MKTNNSVASGSMPRYLTLGNLLIDNQLFAISIEGEKIEVTLIEMKIIKGLIEQYPEMVPRKNLGVAIWGSEEVVMPKTINTHLSNLRIKLGQWNYKIESIKNEGILLKSE